ncbi:MAG: tRNA (N(6)-L-threonylcarbamoyladenosine(37)-C(2))-methylthiotransferase MtaB, partial [Victivallales bacterium]
MEERKKTAAAITVGCRLNQADTALIYGRLKEAGYEILEPDKAKHLDLIVINSCAVTAAASQKSRQYARSYRNKHPEAKIIVTGCDSETEKSYWMQENIADIYIPNTDKSKILDYINGIAPAEKSVCKNIFMENAVSVYPFRSRAFIKIQEGCESFCTYCIVPYARGPERSRDRNEVIGEFRKLIEQGHHEIVLTGVNISTYRDGSCRLSDLLSELSDIDGDFRIRLSSTEPHPENRKLIGIMKDNPKICRFLHLPLQHGTNEILKRMGRKYTAEEFADFANEALSSIPGLHLGTDIICGFPGETEELFEKSCSFISKIPFANLHVFCFSPRKGTPAADFPDTVPGSAMKHR